MTHQSDAARNGNLAERLLCDSIQLNECLSTYFEEKGTLQQLVGRKKSDIQFISTRIRRIQNKNGHVNGRGHSVHRSSIHALVTHEDARTLLRNVCIQKQGDRPCVSKDVSREIVCQHMFGTEYSPDYFTHTKISCGQIHELWICPADTLRDAVLADLYDTMHAKKTCVHISPAIYLQRKGGRHREHAPNDIQIKFRLGPYMRLFKQLL